MEKTNKLTTKKLMIILAAICVVCGCVLGGLVWARDSLKRVATEDVYEYVKPDPTKADTDAGFKIDGVLDEAQYQKNKWLYMSNTEDGADVDIAMTSYFGEKGMYIVYDVTERTPIYVNLDRGSTLNSSIEMYLAPSSVTNLQSNNVFEIDLMPTGDMIFKKTNGKGTYTNVATTDDTMAVLGATTKGGEVNTKECEGYCLELFIPWDYMEWLDIDSSEIKENFVYVNPAHITSFNYEGTSNSTDRYWYHFAQQQGAGFSAVYQYFRFDENGVQGTESTTLTEGEHYSIKGADEVIPGMLTTFKITPEKGHALNSIIVNGEEYIKKVSFDEDGSAILKIRGAKEGLKISAATEEIADGNKTLSGTLTVVKGNLQGVSAIYKGPRGEQALEINGKGKFVLTDLPQGFYTITIEKEGYEKLVRSIYVNRNVDTELVLDYPTFEKVSGANWIMDYHNEGKLYRFGGNGVILTKDSYKKFTFESNFRYDKELAKENENDYFVQQRQGMRIAFSNEKVWHINLINADGKNIVQYGKHTGDNSLFKWKTVHELSESESAKYTSEDGIKLSVQRDGKYANVYLDGKLIAVEILDDEYTKHTAKVGFEGWVANRELWECNYKITNSTSVNLKNTYFKITKGWDVSGQYNGWISLPEGGRGNLSFIDKYVNMDLTLTVRDYQNSTDKEGTYPRNDVLFVFDNGAHISFSVVSEENGAFIQSMNNGADNDLQIYKRWKSWGKLTEEEFEQYKKDGVDFRIVRIGTEVTLYIGDRMVAVADLTNNNRGVTANMEAAITIRHYDDAGVEVKIPFKMTESLDTVKITSVEDEYGKVVTEKENYVVGDTVVLSGEGKEGYYCYAMTVDGKPVKLDELKGTYTFTATNKEYTITGSFAEKVFEDNNGWNLLQQKDSVVSLPNGGNGGRLQFYKQYANMDLTVKAKDAQNSTDKEGVYPRTDVLFVFENGKNVSFSISDTGKETIVQCLNYGDNNAHIYKKYKYWDSLTEEEVAQYKADGVDFRVVRIGTEISIYIGDRMLGVADLTSGDSGVTADMKATVYLRHYDDTGVNIEIPFSVTDEPELVTITHVEGEHGKVATEKKNYVVGDDIVVLGAEKDDYYCYALKVDGKSVELDKLTGGYTFKATKAEYTLEGSYAKKVFEDNSGWNLLEQKDGVVSLPNGGNGGRLQFYKQYVNMDLTVKAKDDQNSTDKKGVYPRTDVLFVFENGKNVSFSISDTGKETIVQCLNYGEDTAHIYKKYKYWDSLTDEEVAQYKDGGVDFRIVRSGTDVFLYIGERLLGVADLANGDSGVTADMKATVYLRHYDDAGVNIEIPFAVNNEVPDVVTIDIENCAYGSFTTVANKCLLGDTVVLTAKANKGYAYKSLQVNGEDVTLDWDGTYSFVTTQDSYTIEGSFAKAIFVEHGNWYLTNQHFGAVAVKNNDYTGYLTTVDNYSGFTITVNDPQGAITDFAMGGQFYFTNDKFVVVQIIESGQGYVIRSASTNTNSLYQMNTYYTLTTEQINKLQDTGIELRVERVGTKVLIFLGGERLEELNVNGVTVDCLDLETDINGNATGIKADTTAIVKMASWGKATGKNIPIEIPFTLSNDEIDAVVVSVKQGANGTIKTDKAVYFAGETVVVTAIGDADYYYDSLKVNGKNVTLGWNGTYSFTATQDSYTIEGSFAPKTFIEHSNWNLTNQNVGLLATEINGNTGYMQTAVDCSVLTLTAKAEARDKYGLGGQFYFELGNNDKWVTFRIHNEGHLDQYYLQCASGTAIYANNTYYVLTDKEVELLQSEQGIEFKVVRSGTQLEFYLGGKQITNILVKGNSVGSTLDLTKDINGNATGITAETPATVKVQYWFGTGELVEIPYALLKNTEPVSVAINNKTTNYGTITTSKNEYVIGERIVVTVAGNSGYYYDSLKINGKEVMVDWNGTFSFIATETSYTIEGSFSEAIFDTTKGNYNWINQNKGVLATSASKNTGYTETKGNYSDVSITVKDSATETKGFEIGVQFYFSNKQYVPFILTRTAAGTYVIKSNSEGAIFKKYTYYTLSNEEVTKLKSAGITMRVVRVENSLLVYLDGKKVETLYNGKETASALDLSAYIDSKTTSIIKIQKWTPITDGSLLEIPFTLSSGE